MKLFKKGFALALVLAMSLSLVACGANIQGEWVGEEDGIEYSYEFDKDGEGSMSVGGLSVDFEYEVDGDELTITYEILGEKTEEEYTFEISGDTLELTDEDGDTLELEKDK